MPAAWTFALGFGLWSVGVVLEQAPLNEVAGGVVLLTVLSLMTVRPWETTVRVLVDVTICMFFRPTMHVTDEPVPQKLLPAAEVQTD